jgi:DeoR family fructose operon transcriptional repressor
LGIGSLAAEARRTVLNEILERDGAVDLATAAVECGVSEMTIRRDLAELEREGRIKRVRGGAVAVEPERFERRLARNRSAKLKIAEKLDQLVPATGIVALDSSSTVFRFAEQFPGSGLSVFTNGMETFQAVRGRVQQALLSGGEFDETTGSLVGPQALRSLGDFFFSTTFISVAGVNVEVGLTDSTLANADFKRALRGRSERLVVAADASKFGATASAVALPLADVDVLVTDLDPADPLLDPYRELVNLL